LRRAHGGRWEFRSYGPGTVSAKVTPAPPDDSEGSGPWVLPASPAGWPREFGAFGEPACGAAEGELRWRPSFTGGVGAAWIPDGNGLRQQTQPDPVRFRRAAGEGVKSVSVFWKRRLCGNRSPESALAILQKSPPAAVWTHDQTHATASICSPFADANFLDRHCVKFLENSAGQLWVRRKSLMRQRIVHQTRSQMTQKHPKKGRSHGRSNRIARKECA